MRDFGLEGKHGLVLGFSGQNSASFHIAKALSSQGAKVAITSRPSKLEELSVSASDTNCELHLGLDATDDASMRAVVERVDAEWGTLDFIVHTLVHVPEGVLQAPLTELATTDFHTVLDIGVLSLVRICGLAAPLLRRSTSGRVVALTSESGMLATPNYHVAGIAKAALESTSRYLALELGRDGILCNLLSFSAMNSDGAARTVGQTNIERTREHLAKRSMTGQPCDWEHVASSALWLCSPHMQNSTGQKIVVDGGYSASYF